MPPSAASDFVNALQKAWRSGDRLRGSTSDLVTMIKTMSGITLDPGLSPVAPGPLTPDLLRNRKCNAI